MTENSSDGKRPSQKKGLFSRFRKEQAREPANESAKPPAQASESHLFETRVETPLGQPVPTDPQQLDTKADDASASRDADGETASASRWRRVFSRRSDGQVGESGISPQIAGGDSGEGLTSQSAVNLSSGVSTAENGLATGSAPKIEVTSAAKAEVVADQVAEPLPQGVTSFDSSASRKSLENPGQAAAGLAPAESGAGGENLPAPSDNPTAAEQAGAEGDNKGEEGSKFARLKQVFSRGQEFGDAAPVDAGAAAPKVGNEKRFGKIKQALARTGKGLGRIFLGKKQIDEDLLDALETQLLTADLGIEVTSEVINSLTDSVKRKELNDVAALQKALKGLLVEILKPCEKNLVVADAKPFVLLTVGVNGVGKTTTIGKLAKQFVNNGRSVMLAAGDTFRAAAVEQLQVWGERNQVAVVAQHTGADSASVIFDAVESARARNIDLLIADTAGRLHTKNNLMEELKKIKRVMAKLDPAAPHEVLLVLDAGTGQNAVNQLQQFHEAVGVTGIVLTKLDGTAKGGVIFALCRRFGIPVRYIGVGEGLDDLQPFNAEDFVNALLSSGSLE